MRNKRISKTERIGREILERILGHSYENGGIYTECTGNPGSAKTSVNLSFCEHTLCTYPKEKVFFSSVYDAPLQFVRLGIEKCNFMVKEGSGVTFHDRANKMERIYPDVTYFTDFDDLYKTATPRMCNAVFFGNRLEWMDFIHYLRDVNEWVSVYFDEFSEVVPSNTSGEEYHKIRQMADDLKECRKCLMNVHTNTQSVVDIDYRVRAKIMVKIYLPGARSDKSSRVTQRAIDNLERNPVLGNEAYILLGGEFGKVRFERIFHPNEKIQWTAKVKK